MNSTKNPGVIAFFALLFGSAITAQAGTITYTTANNTVGGRPVDAQVTFVTGPNEVTVTLENLETKISDISQVISGVSFALDDLKTSTTIGASAGVERTVNSNKTFSDGASVPTGWEILLDGQSMQLMLPDGMDDHSIIGPASGTKYTNANSTIAGNSDNNAFLSGPVSFVIPVNGVTSATTVDWAVFHFGICACYVQACNSFVPEPSSVAMVGMALGCGAIAAWRRRRA
ncbi:MAG TPA: PEP-CTERM sorting domain-containing protein [Pirellulales bacterium]|nr:PEP-CTERM sorting domain-containing protein [Pirellulales bacterium]